MTLKRVGVLFVFLWAVLAAIYGAGVGASLLSEPSTFAVFLGASLLLAIFVGILLIFTYLWRKLK